MRRILLVKPQGRQAVNSRGCLEEEDEEKSHALELGMEVWLGMTKGKWLGRKSGKSPKYQRTHSYNLSVSERKRQKDNKEITKPQRTS